MLPNAKRNPVEVHLVGLFLHEITLSGFNLALSLFGDLVGYYNLCGMILITERLNPIMLILNHG